MRKAGLTLESVNSTLRVGVETDSTKRWRRIKLAKKKPSSSKTSKAAPSQSSKVSSRSAARRAKPTKKTTRVSEVAKAKWRHGGLRGIRLGEASHPGPGPQKLHVLSCNTQGAEGTWRFLHTCALASNADVILLQEVSFTNSMASSFRSTLKKTPFNVFFSKGPSTANVESMEELLSWFEKSWIRNLPFLNVVTIPNLFLFGLMDAFLGQCMPPRHEDSPAEATPQFLDFQVSCEIPISAQWFIGGDFNEIPGKFHFEDICSA